MRERRFKVHRSSRISLRFIRATKLAGYKVSHG
jgi:hypothetical protein